MNLSQATNGNVVKPIVPVAEKTTTDTTTKKTMKELIKDANDRGLTGVERKQFFLDNGRTISTTTPSTITTATTPKATTAAPEVPSLIDKQAQLDIEKQKALEEAKATDIVNLEADQKTLSDTLTANKLASDNYYADIEKEANDFQANYEKEQNDLFSWYESSRLNNVRGQIYQTLAARGVDISKIPPEQLIALSGQVGVAAFNDIYQAKERTKNNILNAAKAKLEKLQALKREKLLNDSQYNERVQSVISTAKNNRANIDKSFANSLLGLKETSLAKSMETQTNISNTLSNVGNALKLNPDQFGILAKFNNFQWTPAELSQAITKEASDKNSALFKALAENKAKANEAAQAELQAKYTDKYATQLSIANDKNKLTEWKTIFDNNSDEKIAAANNMSREAVAKLRWDVDKEVAKTRASNPSIVLGWYVPAWTPSGGAWTSAP